MKIPVAALAAGIQALAACSSSGERSGDASGGTGMTAGIGGTETGGQSGAGGSAPGSGGGNGDSGSSSGGAGGSNGGGAGGRSGAGGSAAISGAGGNGGSGGGRPWTDLPPCIEHPDCTPMELCLNNGAEIQSRCVARTVDCASDADECQCIADYDVYCPPSVLRRICYDRGLSVMCTLTG